MDTQTIDTIDSFLTELSRKELQALAKQHEIKANLKSADIVSELKSAFVRSLEARAVEAIESADGIPLDDAAADAESADSVSVASSAPASPDAAVSGSRSKPARLSFFASSASFRFHGGDAAASAADEEAGSEHSDVDASNNAAFADVSSLGSARAAEADTALDVDEEEEEVEELALPDSDCNHDVAVNNESHSSDVLSALPSPTVAASAAVSRRQSSVYHSAPAAEGDADIGSPARAAAPHISATTPACNSAAGSPAMRLASPAALSAAASTRKRRRTWAKTPVMITAYDGEVMVADAAPADDAEIATPAPVPVAAPVPGSATRAVPGSTPFNAAAAARRRRSTAVFNDESFIHSPGFEHGAAPAADASAPPQTPGATGRAFLFASPSTATAPASAAESLDEPATPALSHTATGALAGASASPVPLIASATRRRRAAEVPITPAGVSDFDDDDASAAAPAFSPARGVTAAFSAVSPAFAAGARSAQKPVGTPGRARGAWGSAAKSAARRSFAGAASSRTEDEEADEDEENEDEIVPPSAFSTGVLAAGFATDEIARAELSEEEEEDEAYLDQNARPSAEADSEAVVQLPSLPTAAEAGAEAPADGAAETGAQTCDETDTEADSKPVASRRETFSSPGPVAALARFGSPGGSVTAGWAAASPFASPRPRAAGADASSVAGSAAGSSKRARVAGSARRQSSFFRSPAVPVSRGNAAVSPTEYTMLPSRAEVRYMVSPRGRRSLRMSSELQARFDEADAEAAALPAAGAADNTMEVTALNFTAAAPRAQFGADTAAVLDVTSVDDSGFATPLNASSASAFAVAAAAAEPSSGCRSAAERAAEQAVRAAIAQRSLETQMEALEADQVEFDEVVRSRRGSLAARRRSYAVRRASLVGAVAPAGAFSAAECVDELPEGEDGEDVDASRRRALAQLDSEIQKNLASLETPRRGRRSLYAEKAAGAAFADNLACDSDDDVDEGEDVNAQITQSAKRRCPARAHSSPAVGIVSLSSAAKARARRISLAAAAAGEEGVRKSPRLRLGAGVEVSASQARPADIWGAFDDSLRVAAEESAIHSVNASLNASTAAAIAAAITRSAGASEHSGNVFDDSFAAEGALNESTADVQLAAPAPAAAAPVRAGAASARISTLKRPAAGPAAARPATRPVTTVGKRLLGTAPAQRPATAVRGSISARSDIALPNRGSLRASGAIVKPAAVAKLAAPQRAGVSVRPAAGRALAAVTATAAMPKASLDANIAQAFAAETAAAAAAQEEADENGASNLADAFLVGRLAASSAAVAPSRMLTPAAARSLTAASTQSKSAAPAVAKATVPRVAALGARAALAPVSACHANTVTPIAARVSVGPVKPAPGGAGKVSARRTSVVQNRK